MLSPAMRTAHRWCSMSFSKIRAICGGWSKEKEVEYMETGSGRGEGVGGWGKDEREKEVAGKGGREVGR